ncbi:hypothetical protein JZ751_005451 [Albula glossodonta]|uniref:Nuclear mitotic apparatus protein 1 N-terminal hook domain-containing protein n=1 Tax=Albula glossodonta TaxID=121402 RepID=A0A8T2N9B8_9TELE|nr:hypothetical protein JZ751_005451 [Albula glossodonta]
MALHREKEDALLAWLNGLNLGDQVDRIALLQDGILLVKLINKLKGRENEDQCPLHQSPQERLEIVSDFLQKYCGYKADRGAVVSWDNIINEKNLDVELSKVVTLLMYHIMMNGLLEMDKLDYKTEFQVAAVLRVVLNNEDSLYLSENLEKFLKNPFMHNMSSVSSTSTYSDDESPVFSKRRRPGVQFLELTTVASSSVGSPIQDVLNTPQFQLRKVHKLLAQERDMRDELERELASSSQIISEKEMQVSQLQYRVQRLMRENAEQEVPKELEELQSRNEGLLKRLHEVLKQCQDLKTNNGQMEKKIDHLTEENGNLSVQIRDLFARLSSAQTMVDNLSEEQESSHAEWKNKKMLLETELCQAVSEKDCLSEKIQILQGKISILEDELRKAQTQTQEQGEVMGPIMEWERLNHEVSELTCKLSHLQETIVKLEQQKVDLQSQCEAERAKFERETTHLQGIISELQQNLCVLRDERETLEKTSREEKETMSAQIQSLNAEIACLSEMVRQKEQTVTVLGQQVEDEQSQSRQLKEEMEKQRKINQETVHGLTQQVDLLGAAIKSKEEESSRQHAILQQATESASRERDSISEEYRQFRHEKDEEVLNLSQQVRQLEHQQEVERSLLSKLRSEKEELELKLASLESAIKNLQNELEEESRKHKETLEAKRQKDSQMESEILELECRVKQLVSEAEIMSQQLNEAREEKLNAESCLDKLTIKCEEVSNTLSAERDQAFQMVLRSMLAEKEDQINTLLQSNQTLEKKIQAVEEAQSRKEEEYKRSISSLESSLAEGQAQIMEKLAAFERQAQHVEVASLKRDLEAQQEIEAKCKEMEHEMSRLQAQFLEASSLASERASELISLRNEVKEKDSLRLQAVEAGEIQSKELEQKVSELQAQILQATSLASERESELISMQNEVKERETLRLQAVEAGEIQSKELEQKVSELQTQVQDASALASERESELISLRNEVKEKDCLRLQAVETLETQRRELEQKVTELQTQVRDASALASERESELISLRNELKEKDSLRLQAVETLETQRGELEQKVSELQTQVRDNSALASERESELISMQNEVKERETLRLQAVEAGEIQSKELEQKVSELQTQVQDASALASERESELISLQNELKEKDSLRLQAVETLETQRRELEQKRESELISLQNEVTEKDSLRLQAVETLETQRRELEQKVSELQAQVQEALTLASERESELCSLQNEVKEKDKTVELEEAQRKEMERKITKLEEELQHASSLAIQKQQLNESLKEELSIIKEKDVLRSHAEELKRKEMEAIITDLKAKILHISTKQGQTAELQQQIVSLKHKNEELLSVRERLLKEQEVFQRSTEDLESQLQRAREELSTLLPLRETMAERSQLNHDLQEQLSAKSEALEHYKAQVEKAKNHYNGKKQQLLEANEKVQAATTALETSNEEVKTLKRQMKTLQLELEQVKGSEKNLASKVNSLQAQLDYADRQLREQTKQGRCDETKPRETVHQKVTEKRQDTSGDSLDLSLDDSLNSGRRPSKRREESSTPVVRSSERLQAKRRARGEESLETLYFTPMSGHNIVDGKLESSITSLGDLVLDSTKKSHSARRRTTQVINITMTKKTPGRAEADPEDGSFYSLQSAQSFPNLVTQKGRPFSFDFSDASTSDQLRNLPGYRRSTTLTTAPVRSISTFRVGAENEPECSEDWMRIAELQARNKACLPHLKSSYPLESRPSLGNPSFVITDDDLRMGDPNETIRRASMMPGQIQDSLAAHRLSMFGGQLHDGPPSHRSTMLPGEISSGVASQRATLQPKQCPNNAQNVRASTLPVKRSGGDLQGPDTPEAKKLSSCFPRPMTPKDRNDRRFASQNRSPNTPALRRQSMMFSIENTPKKNGKSSLLQKGINKMRASTRKSPGSTMKTPRTGKTPQGEKPRRRSPRISNKSPKITSSARKRVSAQFMECVFVQREEPALETQRQTK